MEEKYNESTPNRPQGDRLMDAWMVTVDIPAFIENIRKEKAWKESDRNAISVFKTDGMTIVLVALHKGAEMIPHTSEGLMSIQMLEGKIMFNSVSQGYELKKGHMIALHKGISYRIQAKEESIFLLTVSLTEGK